MGKSVTQIAAALQASGGNVSEAARQLGCTRRAIEKRIVKSTELAAILADERESLADIAEAELLKAIKRGEIAAIIYALKASPAAKKRGWGERTEITGKDGEPIPISIVKMPVDEL